MPVYLEDFRPYIDDLLFENELINTPNYIAIRPQVGRVLLIYTILENWQTLIESGISNLHLITLLNTYAKTNIPLYFDATTKILTNYEDFTNLKICHLYKTL